MTKLQAACHYRRLWFDALNTVAVFVRVRCCRSRGFAHPIHQFWTKRITELGHDISFDTP